jgi:hypothetical protein
MAVDPEIEAKIKEAARILREDGHAIEMKAIRAKLDKHFPDEPEPPEPPDPNQPPAPPKKPDPTPPNPDKPKKSRWWPEEGDAEA